MGNGLRIRYVCSGFLFFAVMLVGLYWLTGKFGPDAPGSYQLKRLFDLNGEANIPAWYSSVLWLAGAFYATRLFVEYRETGLFRFPAFYWLALALCATLLSLDESAGFHEAIGPVVEEFLHGRANIPGLYGWEKAAIPVVVLAGIANVPFLLRLPVRTALGCILAGAIFLSGAIGMESVGALVEMQSISHFPVGLNWHRVIALEEFLEMLGVITLVYTLGRHLEDCQAQSARAVDDGASATIASLTAVLKATGAERQAPLGVVDLPLAKQG